MNAQSSTERGKAHSTTDGMRDALEKIARWEMPESGMFWDKERTQPMSYAAAYGSRGEQEIIQGIATAALSTKQEGEECDAAASPLESGPELLSRLGMDATKWCTEMVKRGVVRTDHSGDDFHAWMCNAIMNAHDIGFGAGERRTEIERMLPLLKQALLLPRPWLFAVGEKNASVSHEEWAAAVDAICGAIDRLSPKMERKS